MAAGCNIAVVMPLFWIVLDLIFEKELLDNVYDCGKRMTDLGTRKRKEINRGVGGGESFLESVTVGHIKAWPWQVAAGRE